MDSASIPELGKSGRDLLIAEMLGDIGKLHDEITALKSTLPQVGDEMRATLETQTGQLHEEASRIEKAVADYQKSQRDGPGTLGMQDQLAVMKATMLAADRTAASVDDAREKLQNAMARIEKLQHKFHTQNTVLIATIGIALFGLGVAVGRLWF